MSTSPLIAKMRVRVDLDKEEGDIAYFNALSLYAEYLTKVITAGLVACLGEDADRHRYTLEHRLVRANAIGEWADTLNQALTGQAAQFFDPNAGDIVRDFTERVGEGDWRHAVVSGILDVGRTLGIKAEQGPKVNLRQFFQMNATVRNKTRGHGATTSEQCSSVCASLDKTLCDLVSGLQLFKQPWAYLHRNLSGKYRVSPLLGDCSSFDYLKRTTDVRLTDGVYLYLDRPVHVPLVFTDSGLLDISLPNGNFRDASFEALSFISNDSRRMAGSRWTAPPNRLPPSETDGLSVLEQVGNVFANLPPRSTGYVSRLVLEGNLRDELMKTDRHPIVTLTGPGGIGKTTLALAAIEGMIGLERAPYDVVIWISARDIDLRETGPKPVQPRVLTRKDIALAVVELLEPFGCSGPKFDPMNYVQGCLTDGAAGPTLFVIDNFETLENPVDVFTWIDTFVRPPNKVLITTRFRDFVGDYPIDVRGMKDDEAQALIDQESERLGVVSLLNATYVEGLIRESDGHPYVIKILLGQVANEQRAVNPERIIANADHILSALFERTYANLRPAAQRVFLLLCSWRVFVPEIAVEAVSLRSRNERFDVGGALTELRRFSLVEEVVSKADGQAFVGVPLAAAMFGRRKLEVSPLKVAVEEDRRLLMEFGAAKREDVQRGVLPRIDRLFRSVAARVSEGAASFDELLPTLEYLASRVPKIYLSLTDLVMECDDPKSALPRAKVYLRTFLETSEPHEKAEVWVRLADLCQSTNDAVGEVHALSEAALLPTVNAEGIGILANRINSRIYELKGQKIEDAWSSEVQMLLERVAEAMAKRLVNLSATDCSRLAWLYLNIGYDDRAREVAKAGLDRDSANWHCRNLVDKLGA